MSQTTSGPTPASPSLWRQEWEKVRPQLQQIEQQYREKAQIPFRVLRVNQVDAATLDREITDILKGSFLKIFEWFPATWVHRFQPELDGVLHGILFCFSILRGRPTFGLQLQNLMYRDERQAHGSATDIVNCRAAPALWQRVLFGLMLLGERWLWVRLGRALVDAGWADAEPGSWRRRCWQLYTYAEVAAQAASAVNFLAFLVYGRYRSLPERLLHMRLVFARTAMRRHVSFEYMNRQLVWAGFSEFLLFLLPLVSVDRLRAIGRRLLLAVGAARPAPGSGAVTAPATDGLCGFCSSPPRTAVRTACGHRLCHYCAAARVASDALYPCPQCGAVMAPLQRCP